MKDYKVFDIIGPVMIGPSSSHTAGACRIAKVARNIAGKGFNEVEFVLHGSFAETYKGHGTDRALLAGAMGFQPDDKRLRSAFEIADAEGLEYSYRREDLGKVHSNSAKIIMKYPDGHEFSVIGSSIGGGNIVIVEINGVPVTYTDEFPTLLVKYDEQTGVISYISTLLSDNNYNIESIRTIKSNDEVTCIVETTEDVDDHIIDEIVNNPRFKFAKYITSEE